MEFILKATTFNGDSLLVLKKLASNSVHSIVTDPPAGIGFLGHEWDKDKGGREQWIAWLENIMHECIRILKPGGHAVVWALPRTSHWTATALENAGFEIRDVATHIFNSGVPASGDIGSKVDKFLGVKPKVVGFRRNPCSTYYNGSRNEGKVPILEPQSSQGRKWAGWMPRLKPASEHWIIARRPLDSKALAENVLKHSTGAMNVGGCRVSTPRSKRPADYEAVGRFPSNVLLSHAPGCREECQDGCVVGTLKNQSMTNVEEYFNTFLFCPKAPKHERLEGVNDESK